MLHRVPVSSAANTKYSHPIPVREDGPGESLYRFGVIRLLFSPPDGAGGPVAGAPSAPGLIVGLEVGRGGSLERGPGAHQPVPHTPVSRPEADKDQGR